MSAPREIIELIDRYTRNADSYRSGYYGETQVRREFIDPFFKCLGWDIDNNLGFAEAYKDVFHEDAIKVGGVTKAPDYCFRVGGTRKQSRRRHQGARLLLPRRRHAQVLP